MYIQYVCFYTDVIFSARRLQQKTADVMSFHFYTSIFFSSYLVLGSCLRDKTELHHCVLPKKNRKKQLRANFALQLDRTAVKSEILHLSCQAPVEEHPFICDECLI